MIPFVSMMTMLLMTLVIPSVSGLCCTEHFECPCTHPMCNWDGQCVTCDSCNYCDDGIDGTCGGSCTPSMDWSSCYSDMSCDAYAVFEECDEMTIGGPLGTIIGVIVALLASCGGAFVIWKKFQKCKKDAQPYLDTAKSLSQTPMGKKAMEMAKGKMSGALSNEEEPVEVVLPAAAVVVPPAVAVVVPENEDEDAKAVRRWMKDEVRMPDSYADKIIENGYDRMDAVRRMSVTGLESMGITKAGHKKIIMNAVKDLAQPEQQRLLPQPQQLSYPVYQNGPQYQQQPMQQMPPQYAQQPMQQMQPQYVQQMQAVPVQAAPVQQPAPAQNVPQQQ